MAYADKESCDIALGGLIASLAHHLNHHQDGSLPLRLNFSQQEYSAQDLQEVCDWANSWLIADDRGCRIWRIKQRADWFTLYILPLSRLN